MPAARQRKNKAWVAGAAPFISPQEFKNNFVSGWGTVLISTIEGEGMNNQPFGKFFNTAQGHAEANFLTALRANDWVFDEGYHEIVIRINNSPCLDCCSRLEKYMEEICERFPNTTLVIETANLYRSKVAANRPFDDAGLAALSRVSNIRVDFWNVALENEQNDGARLTPDEMTKRIERTLRTSDRTNTFD